ncbi:N-acetylneuraminate synthase family protein [Halobellus litoreus]|uniref:N-acetylneuraminate synthase family protein n=1 Tax=Halobellus litoreus TaxID=755310 RepID=A0ABD6DUN0_9EURY|nr:N-acetylneuraminate synthase family protein [Halobellus litoreus]
MKIAGKDLSEETFVIAEAGSNHNGSLETAKELIDAASDAGADAVKFQTFRAENLYVEETGEKETYFDNGQSLYETMESMEMPYDWIPELHQYCEDSGIVFLSTPFDERSADELDDFVPAYKIASYTLSHHPFLRHVAEKDKPIIMSTGAHELDEVREAVEVLREADAEDVVLLHCVASYPTPIESANVRAVKTLQDEFGVPTGLSDHTLDPTVAPSAAVALGASVVEKHFTLDKSMEGPDHEFALEPDELDEMVSTIRKTEKALGSGIVEVLDAEEELHEIARRRIHAVRGIKEGQTISEEDIAVLRSGQRSRGAKPKFYEDLIGTRAKRSINQGDGVSLKDIY